MASPQDRGAESDIHLSSTAAVIHPEMFSQQQMWSSITITITIILFIFSGDGSVWIRLKEC